MRESQCAAYLNKSFMTIQKAPKIGSRLGRVKILSQTKQKICIDSNSTQNTRTTQPSDSLTCTDSAHAPMAAESQQLAAAPVLPSCNESESSSSRRAARHRTRQTTPNTYHFMIVSQSPQIATERQITC